MEENKASEFIVDVALEEILTEFLAEAKEGIVRVEQDFLTLEKDPDNKDILNNIFRTVHSMKGASSFIGFKNLEEVSHKAEDVLNKLRKSELTLSPSITDTLLSAVDVIGMLLQDIEEHKKDTNVNTEEIKVRLAGIMQESEPRTQNTEPRTQNTEHRTQNTEPRTQNTEHRTQNPEHRQQTTDSINPTNPTNSINSTDSINSINSMPQQTQPAKPTQPTQLSSKSDTKAAEESQSIRINIDKLDYLFNLIGELVLIRNRNIQLHKVLSKKYPDDETIHLDLNEAGSYLSHLTSEIQLAVMKARMIPVSTVFNKFRRVVRDIAKNLGKEIELRTEGDDTEIDKNIIEGIGDPLTHIIRNSADHGIETSEEREKAGKKRTGYIDLKAYYEGNYVVISIKDDGKGIDVKAVKQKAIEKGLITKEDSVHLSKQAILNLTFAPGFSTAKAVTSTSGRGVGMDVVKTNIERLRGQIILDSQAGSGTEIKLKIPLTLAILDCLIVNVSEHRYAIPLTNVVETYRIKYGSIDKVRGSRVFRMRDELLPVVALSDVFNLSDKGSSEAALNPRTLESLNPQDEELTIIVLRHGILKTGLLVDNTSGQEEIVIKPLDCLDGITEPYGVSGATILGDGAITFILDVDVLIKLSRASDAQLEGETSDALEDLHINDGSINVVLVDNLDTEQYAIAARNIKEIELIQKRDIEEIGGRLRIRYKGKIMPLNTIHSITNVPVQREFDSYYMIILTDKGMEAGLLVGRLLGIRRIEESSISRDNEGMNAVCGSLIFNDRITLLINAEEIISSHNNMRM
ncbi:MAG: chemotaxis protein CheW [Nitrospirae bacterium]|nr:chemotaxis protein CheW [Nitrospirota bacterium]